MGTIADELKKVMTQWDNTSTTETNAKETTVNTTTNNSEQRMTIRDKLMLILNANPGVNGVELCDLTAERYPEVSKGSLTSTITQLAQQHYATRKPATVNNRASYCYYPVDDSTRKALVAEEERQLKLARARAEKARAAKAAKAAERQAEVEPNEPAPVVTQAPAPAPAPTPEPAPIIKSTWDAKTALEGISVLQARELYNELKNIFGN